MVQIFYITIDKCYLGMIDQRNANGSTTWMKKITSKNDSFTRVHEDPIVQIKKEEKKVSS